MKTISKFSTVIFLIFCVITFVMFGGIAFSPKTVTSTDDAAIWEKIDIDLTTVDEYSGGGFEFEKKSNIWRINEGEQLPSLNYLYLFIQAAGGQGSIGGSNHAGYGGGAGGFVIAKINLAINRDRDFKKISKSNL